jgi:hypothetical protein
MIIVPTYSEMGSWLQVPMVDTFLSFNPLQLTLLLCRQFCPFSKPGLEDTGNALHREIEKPRKLDRHLRKMEGLRQQGRTKDKF